MIPKQSKTMLKEFREFRKQFEEPPKQVNKPQQRKDNSVGYYELFLRKYDDLENSIDKLGTRDLVYYFREIAGEHGHKYVISNIKKDMAIMKRLRTNYDTREICAMIEFLYESDQDYLEKDRLSPNILASSWVNTIYADMKLWVEDKYNPRSVKEKNSKKSKGEWKSSSDSKTEIGLSFE